MTYLTLENRAHKLHTDKPDPAGFCEQCEKISKWRDLRLTALDLFGIRDLNAITVDEIKKIFHKLSLRFHPDKAIHGVSTSDVYSIIGHALQYLLHRKGLLQQHELQNNIFLRDMPRDRRVFFPDGLERFVVNLSRDIKGSKIRLQKLIEDIEQQIIGAKKEISERQLAVAIAIRLNDQASAERSTASIKEYESMISDLKLSLAESKQNLQTIIDQEKTLQQTLTKTPEEKEADTLQQLRNHAYNEIAPFWTTNPFHEILTIDEINEREKSSLAQIEALQEKYIVSINKIKCDKTDKALESVHASIKCARDVTVLYAKLARSSLQNKLIFLNNTETRLGKNFNNLITKTKALESLAEKERKDKLNPSKYQAPSIAARTLVTALLNEQEKFLKSENSKQDKESFCKQCLLAIETAKTSDLKNHRGWTKLLAAFVVNLSILLATCGFSIVLSKNHTFRFFKPDTDSVKQLKALEKSLIKSRPSP